MKGSEKKLVAYMQGADNRFVIPVYQRNYDWKTENCKQLYNDLIKVIQHQRKSHFFGSIVSVFNPDGENSEFLVIDGQQRLTTVSLLFLAMYNLMKKGIVVPQRANLADKIYRTYLIDEWQEDDTRIKLKPVKNDCTAFKKLFEDEAEYIRDSNITINYLYFYNRIQKEEITVDELYDAICRLEIISIILNQDDNPQLIFESLNSTGLALSEGDKIRNYMLMGLPTKQQNIFYEKYWNKIELATLYNVSTFIRDYLSVKQQVTPSMNTIYFTFKDYVEENELDTELLLQDLLAYAKRYELLLKGKTGCVELDDCLYRLNRLETTVIRPFFLEVLRLREEKRLSNEEVTDIFLITESYLFRRTMCDLPTNALNKIFLFLHKEIMRYDGTDENYVSKFVYALLSKGERGRFPDDDEFLEAIANRQVYLMNSKNKIYMLERFENFGTKEDRTVYTRFDAGTYSIEHIMPQHLTPIWVESLGPDYEQIHETWLHRIANLTLTAYNSNYSNRSFSEKKNTENGFIDSGLRMNQRIAQNNSWGLAELEERCAYLQNRALKIWPTPITDFVPRERELDTCTLDDDRDFTGRQVVRFRYRNTEQPVASWTDLYQKVLSILHAQDQTVLNKFAVLTGDDLDLARYVSTEESAFIASVKIENGIYVNSNLSTSHKMAVLRKFFKVYREDTADLMFYLRIDREEQNEKSIGPRYDLRRRFWTYALPNIQQFHEESGPFSNVSPTKMNWINGFIGIRGFNLVCVANYDSARVELYLGKSNKSENKSTFDYLLRYRRQIEEACGRTLEWNRKDDTKSSKIYVQLNDVSIENETDWRQMAKFLGEWSKRFYDIIVPYLQINHRENSKNEE